jgi:hypothetical protein
MDSTLFNTISTSTTINTQKINKTIVLILSLACFFLIICIVMCKLNKLNNLTIDVDDILKKHTEYSTINDTKKKKNENKYTDDTTFVFYKKNNTTLSTSTLKQSPLLSSKDSAYFLPYTESNEIEEFTQQTLPSYINRNKQDIDDNLIYYPQQTSNFYGYPGLFITTQHA